MTPFTGPRIIQADDIPSLFPGFPTNLNNFLAASNPIFAGYYQDSPACVAGFVPQQRSGTTLLWGWTTPIINAHPLIHVRFAARLIRRALCFYPTVIGYCSRDKAHWIKLLGGITEPGPDDHLFFTIGDPL